MVDRFFLQYIYIFQGNFAPLTPFHSGTPLPTPTVPCHQRTTQKTVFTKNPVKLLNNPWPQWPNRVSVCTVYTVYCTLHTVHCTLYTLQSKVINNTVYCVQFKV